MSSQSDLKAIEKHFHELIRQRAADFNITNPPLPDLEDLVRQGKNYHAFAIDGMYGGFKFRIEGSGPNLKLISESWSRVVGGSGQLHHITVAGCTLVEDSTDQPAGVSPIVRID